MRPHSGLHARLNTRRLLSTVAVVVISLVPAVRSGGEEVRLKSALEGIRREHAKRHIEALADDTFEGREAGSRGGRAAGVYLGKEFQKLALAGAATSGGYYQAFGNGYRNILARLEGSDPELKRQYILIGAHYDHVGYGTASNSYGPTGYIHNGADDNASGTAALLEIAGAFVEIEPRPKRTIIFALWDAEEKGLLGSKHWLANPTLPLEDLALSVNMDMVGRVRKDWLEVSGTRTAAGLRRIVSQHNRDLGLVLDFTWEIEDNSDHHPFYESGIPILMLHSGLHSDYHRPSDDVERIDNAGIERTARLIFGAVWELADRPERPAFRTAARRESLGEQRASEVPAPSPPSRFGVRWNESAAGAGGVTITSVDPRSPAAIAELRRGDRIVRFAGRDVTDGEMLRALVATATPETTVMIDRAGQSLERPLALRGNPTRLGIGWRTDAAQPGCVIINRVTPGSPAAKADIRVNDVVYQIAGQDFGTSDDFLKLATTLPMPLEFLVERQGQIGARTIQPWLPAEEPTKPETAQGE